MKSVVVTIPSQENREIFERIINENGLSEEFKRSTTTDWYMSFPDEVDREYLEKEVEDIMFEIGFEKGKDYIM